MRKIKTESCVGHFHASSACRRPKESEGHTSIHQSAGYWWDQASIYICECYKHTPSDARSDFNISQALSGINSNRCIIDDDDINNNKNNKWLARVLQCACLQFLTWSQLKTFDLWNLKSHKCWENGFPYHTRRIKTARVVIQSRHVWVFLTDRLMWLWWHEPIP